MKSLVENKNLESNNNLMNIFKGVIISFGITFVLLFLFAVLLTYSNIGEETIPVVIIVMTVISILVGSSLSTRKIRRNGLINGGIIGLVYIVTIYLISSFVTTGFSMNVYSIVMMILSIMAGLIGGIVGVNIDSFSRKSH